MPWPRTRISVAARADPIGRWWLNSPDQGQTGTLRHDSRRPRRRAAWPRRLHAHGTHREKLTTKRSAAGRSACKSRASVRIKSLHKGESKPRPIRNPQFAWRAPEAASGIGSKTGPEECLILSASLAASRSSPLVSVGKISDGTLSSDLAFAHARAAADAARHRPGELCVSRLCQPLGRHLGTVLKWVHDFNERGPQAVIFATVAVRPRAVPRAQVPGKLELRRRNEKSVPRVDFLVSVPGERC